MADYATCPLCGNLSNKSKICHECQSSPPKYDGLRSWGIYAGFLRLAIQQFKYERNIGLSDTFAPALIFLVHQINRDFDMIVPVPLSKARLQERGYNQSKLMSIPIHLALSIPISTRALLRVQHTPSQVGLRGGERRINVRNAFSANSCIVKAKNILVVDDVTTTGATMRACSETLIQAGAKSVFGITLARAGLSSHPDSLSG